MPGPLPLPDDQRRVHRLGVWMSEIELRQLEVCAALPGLAEIIIRGSPQEKMGAVVKDAADYLRNKGLYARRRIPAAIPAVNTITAANLGKIGGNLTRLYGLAANMPAGSAELLTLLSIVRTEVRAVQRELHGRNRPEAETVENNANDKLLNRDATGAADEFKFEF